MAKVLLSRFQLFQKVFPHVTQGLLLELSDLGSFPCCLAMQATTGRITLLFFAAVITAQGGSQPEM